MAGGANSRKQKSASEGCGTGVRSTTSYQPQTPLPHARPSAEESANSSQAGRCPLVTVRA